MTRRLVRLLGWLAAFLAPVLLYFVLWGIIQQDVLNRVGYALWLYHGPDEAGFLTRIVAFRVLVTGATPMILGIAGVCWRARRIRRRTEVDVQTA